MKAALAGIVAAILIAVVGAVALKSIDASSAHRFAVPGTVRL